MAFERGHALVIGVGSYTHIPWADIPISVTDARAMREVLVNPDLCGYPSPQVTLLHDATASKDGVLAALGALRETPEDHTVLLYYCGHGANGADGNYYLTTHESQVSNNKVVKGTGISEAELLDALRQIRAKRLLLLFNACHSGELSPSLAPETPAASFGDLPLSAKSVDALLSTGEGRVIIAACRPEQKSWIGGGKLSIFTQALVDGLSGQGYVPNNNGFVGAFGLYEHVYEAVKAAAGKLGKVQEPELTVLRGVGPFAVALYKGATDLGSFDAAETVADGMAVRTVEPARSQRLYQQTIKTITASAPGAIAAETISSGTVVGGTGNVVQMGGKYNISMGTVQGAVIGDNAQVQQRFTSVDTGGGDYAGRDQTIRGDLVKGDKVGGAKVMTGDITGSNVTFGSGLPISTTQGLTGAEIAALFQPLTQMIQQAPPEKRDEAMRLEQELQAEVAKGEEADDGRMAGLLNGLLKLVPGAVGAAVSIFATPMLSGVAGELTKMVLKMFGG
jgi:hypothetical protein